SQLVDFLRTNGSGTTAAFLKKANPADVVGASWTGQRISSVLDVLESYQELIAGVSGTRARELALLVSYLKAHRDAGIDEFVTAAEAAVKRAKEKPVRSAKKPASTDEG